MVAESITEINGDMSFNPWMNGLCASECCVLKKCCKAYKKKGKHCKKCPKKE